MNGEFIDTDEFGVNEREIELVCDELNDVVKGAKYRKWWEKNDLPQGLQCIEIHMWQSTREWVEKLARERNLPTDKLSLFKMAVVIDSMIS